MDKRESSSLRITLYTIILFAVVAPLGLTMIQGMTSDAPVLGTLVSMFQSLLGYETIYLVWTVIGIIAALILVVAAFKIGDKFGKVVGVYTILFIVLAVAFLAALFFMPDLSAILLLVVLVVTLPGYLLFIVFD
ncbi:hypothetical protein [Culicoidibacter larvae]|uniref:Uncharacterized protein n=1 Tax=Culicoidibacter larvae TaxID=2579976 RepID=A0A5R8QC91_9FIRM|nr:hypothetical protein [Culicoidibacter larvae]TLG72732.1 hypothetical protein FEZ08_08500 [Culicoidibacter larvae]